MDKKACFFDIDGTIYNFDIQVPQDTKDAIRKLRENGHLAFISTGRSLAYISEDILEVGFDGVLAGCGTYISYHDKEYLNLEIPIEDLMWIKGIFDRFNLSPVIEGRDWLYFDEIRYPFEKENSKGSLLDDIFKDVTKPVTGNENNYFANKVTMFCMGFDRIDEAVEAFEEKFDVIRHGNQYLEIVPRGYNKGTGIKKICEILGIDMKNTFAFGDSANDLGMFEVCNTSICMGNGTPDAKEAADYITDTMTEGGIKNALKHFNLI